MYTFVCILAAMFSTGVMGVAAYCVFSLVSEDEWALVAVAFLVGLPIAIIVALAPWALIGDETSPDLATLKNNEWFCSAKHTAVTTTLIMSGKTMVPVVTSHVVCDQYNRK